MIRPVNGHLLIEPLKNDSFMVSEKGTYQEIGVVKGVSIGWEASVGFPKIGDKVYFDSWLAGKFPKEKAGEYWWLVKWDDVKAIDDGNEKN